MLRSLLVLTVTAGALAAGWWLGASTVTPRPPSDRPLAGQAAPMPAMSTRAAALSGVSGTGENHDSAGSSDIDGYCRSVWGGRDEHLAACKRAETAARFELVAMCGTEEMMEMWRSCATTSPSHAVQRHCLKRRLNAFQDRHEHLSGKGLDLVATAEMAGGRELKVWQKDTKANAALSESLLAVAAGDRVIHVGASTEPVAQTLTRWRQTINTGLAGRRSLSPGFDLDGWIDILLEHGVLEIYARKGDLVETRAGRFNAYRAEAQHLAAETAAPLPSLLE